MASAQVDRLTMSLPTATPDMTGNAGAEHVAPGPFSPIQDANLLREAALRSRRRKQAASREQPTPTPIQSIKEPSPLEKHVVSTGDEDVQMEDATTRLLASSPKHHCITIDAEDGEILENGQADSSDAETDPREKTPRPLSDGSDSGATTVSGPEEPKYVRPGLNMTARDLNEAKRLILDLLGLGVTPEYLVDCGVSPQCLAVCFYEMNLRFPLNLDRCQIKLPPVYDLEKHMKNSQRREQIIRQRDRNQPSSKLNHTTATSAPEDSRFLASSRSLSFDPSNSEKEQYLADASPVVLHPGGAQLTNLETAGTQTAVVVDSPPAGLRLPKEGLDSALMEDQKRTELLARKAAMESINRKRAANPLTTSGMNNSSQSNSQPRHMEIKDVESAVDELLASVRMDSTSSSQSEERPSQKRDDGSTGSGEILPDYDSDAMVEDELEARSPSFSDPEVDNKLMDSTLFAADQRNLSPEPMSFDVPMPTPSASRVRFEAPDGFRSSSLPAQPVSIVVPVVARRSRPIASDFIDQTPPRPSSVLQSEPQRGALLKRKRSFVDPAVWPKRLVINLDSSDEEDEEEEARPTASSASASSGSGSAERAPSRSRSQDKPANDGRDLAAQMLLEKELQIKAMMQKIKMRELQRKKSASGSRTPALAAVSIASTSSTTGVPKTPAAGSASVVSLSPKLSTVNNTPMETPKFEVPPESVLVPAEKQELTKAKELTSSDEASAPLNDSLGIIMPKLDKGKGKAIEPEEAKDVVMNVSTVVASNTETQPERPLNSMDEKQAPVRIIHRCVRLD